jgi:alpha-mannosidase
VAVVNDSTYGFDVTREATDGDVTTTVRLSLLRAPRFPDPETDQGEQTHRYGLVIGADVAAATAAGALLNTDERTVLGDKGIEPLVVANGQGIVLSSVKLAADRSGDLVVRVYESLGRRASGLVRVTVPVSSVVEVDLVEEPLPESAVGLPSAGGAVALAMKAFDVRTLRFTLRPASA